MPIACAPTVGRLTSNVDIAAWVRARVPSGTRGSPPSSFSLAPRAEPLPAAEQARARHPAVVEEDLRGGGGAQAVLAQLEPALEPRGASRHDERGLPARAELGLDRRHDHVQARDAAVGGPRLLPVEHPLVLGLVVPGAR